jgi:2-C-methyl-D-erythritol 4-phosphate cytidylyltransferase
VRLFAVLPLPPAEHPGAVLTQLAGESALRRIVAAFAPAVQQVLVVAEAGLAEQAGAELAGLPAKVIVVGEKADRAECLAAAARVLRTLDGTHVLLADHRYPLLPAGLITRVAEALAAGHESVVPVLPVTDTVKAVDGQGSITSNVDRAGLQTLQYPHGMTVGRLVVPALDGATTVLGDSDALAANLPDDAPLLEAVIACR